MDDKTEMLQEYEPAKDMGHEWYTKRIIDLVDQVNHLTGIVNDQQTAQNAANDSSMIAKGAITPTPVGGRSIPIPGSTAARVEGRLNELKAENETLRALLRNLRIPETKDFDSLKIQNEVLAAVIDGHLFKERMTEIVRLVLYMDLDDFLEMRFSKGAKFKEEAIAEVKARLEALTNKPEQNHGR